MELLSLKMATEFVAQGQHLLMLQSNKTKLISKLSCNHQVVIILLVGYGVVIVKNGHRICGTGAALANAPIQQNKAYFEAKLQSSGCYF